MLTGHDENGKRVGRKIKWDAKKEVIIGDPEATKLLSRQYRAPLKLA